MRTSTWFTNFFPVTLIRKALLRTWFVKFPSIAHSKHLNFSLSGCSQTVCQKGKRGCFNRHQLRENFLKASCWHLSRPRAAWPPLPARTLHFAHPSRNISICGTRALGRAQRTPGPSSPATINRRVATSHGHSRQRKSLKINCMFLIRANGGQGTALFTEEKKERVRTFLKAISQRLTSPSQPGALQTPSS